MKILQISDIHWHNIHALTDVYRDIREGLIQDIRNYCYEKATIFDHILICGDIAYSGNEVEYRKADEFLNELCNAAGCKPSEVFMVPGNHDKNIFAECKSTREILNQTLAKSDKNDETLCDWIENDKTSLQMLYHPFYNYDQFTTNYGCTEPLMRKLLSQDIENSKDIIYNEKNDTMYWEDELGNGLNGYHVRVYGVNTALTSDLQDYDPGVRDDGHKLFLPKIAYKGGHKTDGNINILMAHHPILFLASPDNIRTDLDERYQIQLFGHVHISKSNCENNAVHVFSGSLQPGEGNQEYRPVFNMIDLDVRPAENGGDNLHINLQVHYWNGRRFEYDINESSQFQVKLTNNNRWKEREQMEHISLPEGISKREIRIAFTKSPIAREIMDEMDKGLFCYDNSQPLYSNKMRFLDVIMQYNLWGELWSKINK